MQPRQLGLVFCSKNNNAKQALPDQKDSRELEMSILVMEKGGSSGVTSKKGAENEQGIFTHTFFFPLPFYLLARTAFRPGCFGFVLLKLKAFMWLRSIVLGRDTAQNSHASTDSEEHPMYIKSYWPQWDIGSGTYRSTSTEWHKCHAPEDKQSQTAVLN